MFSPLYLSLDFGGEDVLGLGVLSGTLKRLSGGGVELHKAGSIELGLLDDLDLADTDVLKGEDLLAGLLDGLADRLRDELADEVTELALRGLLLHDADHTLADGADLGGLSVAGGLLLVGLTLGEGDAEHAELVPVKCLDINVSLDERVPFTNQRAKVVTGDIHAVEVSQAVASLDVLAGQLHLSVSLVFISLEVSEVALVDTALQGVLGELCRKPGVSLFI